MSGVESDAGRPCYRCGKDPAEGYASVWTAVEGERWYCHGDDDDVTCYMRTQMSDAGSLSEVVTRLLNQEPTP